MSQVPSVEGRDPVYLGYYAQLQHQQNMLQDAVRTSTYQKAINYHSISRISGGLVMDMGSGSGILSYFAVQAGAAKVFAVEASAMADKAKKIIDNANKKLSNSYLAGKVEVIKGKIENIQLPVPKVHVLVSEPIGVFLVHERMLESYIFARDNFLAKGGLMLPSSGRIQVAPFTDSVLWSDTISRARFWESKNFYNVDLSSLYEDAFEENFSMPVVGVIPPESILIASQTCPYKVDFHTVTQQQLLEITIPLCWDIAMTGLIHGLAGWFDLCFADQTQMPNALNPAPTLDTSPYAPVTHWQQVRFLLQQPLAVNAGQRLTGRMHLKANEARSYTITAELQLQGLPDGTQWGRRIGNWRLEDQTYYQTPSMSTFGTEKPEYYGLYSDDPTNLLAASNAAQLAETEAQQATSFLSL